MTWEECVCVCVHVSYQKTLWFALTPDLQEWAGSCERHGRYAELHLEWILPEESSGSGCPERLWQQGRRASATPKRDQTHNLTLGDSERTQGLIQYLRHCLEINSVLSGDV